MSDRNIDDEIDAWHGGPDVGLQLHEFLDMTWFEYTMWVQHSTLPEGWAQREVSRVRP